jgi:Na+/serine symporter
MSLVVGIVSFILIPLKIGASALNDRFWVINLIVMAFALSSLVVPAFLVCLGIKKGKYPCCTACCKSRA